jgi:acyl-CoA reductase-like NAD-dependent aldehyde dehydrogenase
MNVTDNQIEEIVDRVVDKLAAVQNESPRAAGPVIASAAADRGCFNDIASACQAARMAFLAYRDVPVEQRKRIIAAVRKICLEHLPELARRALVETGLGRYEDKLKKNRLAIEKTPGVEDLEPEAFSGGDGLTIQERAPFGVIGSITPCTNPSETIICNVIGMIAGGNAVVFNPHPAARGISVYTVNLLNQAVISEGGPPNLVTTVANPTIESAQALMKHADIRLLVVTGGPAVVAVAMKSGKRVIAAGPGNPPVVVDETADLQKAAGDIVASAGCDNNIICVVEKEIIVTDNAAAGLKKALLCAGAIELGGHQARRLEKIVLDKGGCPNKAWVGKDIQLILQQIGMDVPPEKRIAIVETGADHPFAREEMLMPVLPFIRVRDIDAAIELAYRLENGCFHTAVIHSRNIEHMHRMAKKMNTTIFVKNGMALAGLGLGGEGCTSFTIASPSGEGITSAKHFTRMRRCTLSGYFRIT